MSEPYECVLFSKVYVTKTIFMVIVPNCRRCARQQYVGYSAVHYQAGTPTGTCVRKLVTPLDNPSPHLFNAVRNGLHMPKAVDEFILGRALFARLWTTRITKLVSNCLQVKIRKSAGCIQSGYVGNQNHKQPNVMKID